MKTIFKGIINGVKYDDITTYNDRIKELINKGEAFNASTTSCTVEGANLFPHGKITENDGKIEVDPSFIDKSNKLTLSALRDELANKFTPIIEDIQKMNEVDLDIYIDELEALGDWFESIKAQNTAASESVKARIDVVRETRRNLIKQLESLKENIRQSELEEEALTRNLKYLNKSDRVIAEWDRAYENIYHTALEEFSKYEVDGIKEDDKSEEVKSESNKTPDTLQELWECIFGK